MSADGTHGGGGYTHPITPSYPVPPPPPPPTYPPPPLLRFNGNAKSKYPGYPNYTVQPSTSGSHYNKTELRPPLPAAEPDHLHPPGTFQQIPSSAQWNFSSYQTPPPPPPPPPILRMPRSSHSQVLGTGSSPSQRLNVRSPLYTRTPQLPQQQQSRHPRNDYRHPGSNMPHPPPMHHFQGEGMRVRRTFVHDEFVPLEFGYSYKDNRPKPSSNVNVAIQQESGSDVPDDVKPKMEVPLSWNNGNFESQELNPGQNIIDTKLPFVPVAAESIDLARMTKVIEEEKAKANSATINALERQGVIESTWPKQLREMFQPLYCKLCTLTLSSAIVAKAHYMGKKHRKCIDGWLQNYRREEKKALKSGSLSSVQNWITTRGIHPESKRKVIATARIISPEELNTAADMAGAALKPPGTDTVDSINTTTANAPIRPPISGANLMPLGNCARWGKRAMEPNNLASINAKEGISKRFPLGRPPVKKSKQDSNGGKNFDFCDICNVALTSHTHAEQHYGGQKHKKKLANSKIVPPAPDIVRPASLHPDELYSAPQLKQNLSFQYF